MLRYHICFTLLILSAFCYGQLSSSDIRNASSDGPYPIYLTLQYAKSTSIESFRTFTRSFYEPENVRLNALRGVEANIGAVINETGIRFSIESGFRYLVKNLDRGNKKVNMTEEVASLRFGYRFNILYPVTAQIQVGPVFHHMSSIRIDSSRQSRRIQAGRSVFKGHGLMSGLDTRARIMLFDPAGTSGGLGIFAELRYLWNFKDRPLQPYYSLLNQTTTATSGWDYFSFSAGVVVPLALRIR